MNYGRVYIKVPHYVQQFIRTKYQEPGDMSPVYLPFFGHPAGKILYSSLICNPMMKRVTPTCYTEQMFNIQREFAPTEIVDNLPDNEARRDFISFRIAEPHFFNGRWIPDDHTMQLDQESTAKFRDILMDEFWSALDEFWKSYCEQFRIDAHHSKPIFYDALLDFMEFYRITVDDIDALYRAVKRRKNKLNSTTKKTDNE